MNRPLRALLAATLLALTSTVLVAGGAAPAGADGGQMGQPQVVINPGGGNASDGSDGVRFTMNASGGGWTYIGGDEIWHRGTVQYCCSGAAPMLNVGGQLFGQAGPAYAPGTSWSSVEVLATSGAAVLGGVTAETGSGSATIRYTAVRNGLTYVVERTASYTYPNDGVDDSYTFVIPDGNTEAVKFYLGGDAAPGSSDAGVGLMVTSPVRSVVSVNPYSQIMVAYREVPGSKPFDGAVSQNFYAAYDTVTNGGDIGFNADPNLHDAGIMMQWNLGSTPGTQSARMQLAASAQGTNLSAGFDRELVAVGAPFRLDLPVVNSRASVASGIGYTFELPAGIRVAPGATANTCGGTLTAPADGGTVSLAGGSVGALADCLVSVPVVATAEGAHQVTSASVTASTGISNAVATSTVTAAVAPSWAPVALDPWTVGTAAGGSVAASGTGPMSYAVTGGAFPDGVSMSPTGVVSGVPTAAGPYSVTVTASNLVGEASATVSGTVAKGSTGGLGGTIAATAGGATVAYGGDTTLSATGLPPAATGTVTFSSGGVDLCTATLPAVSCAPATPLEVGTYPDVRVRYSGDDDWLPSEAGIGDLVVARAGAALNGSLPEPEVPFGAAATVAAAVSPAEAIGTIRVESGDVVLCTITLPEASCTTPDDLPAGSHPIALHYSGDARYLPATADGGVLVVLPAATAVTSADVTTTYGTAASVTAAGLPHTATGTITVTEGETVLCSFVVGEGDSCDLPADLPGGDHLLVVAYGGDANHLASTAPVTVSVARRAVEFAATVARSYVGTDAELVTIGLPEAATGTIDVRIGDEQLCTIALPATSCTMTGFPSAGTFDLAVSYSGDGNHEPAEAEVAWIVSDLPQDPADPAAPVAPADPADPAAAPATAQARPDALPRTGSTVGSWLLCGLVLLVAGGVLVHSASRRPATVEVR